MSPLTLPSRILCIQIDTACLWTGESDHFLTQNSHQQAHKEKAFYYLADAKIRLLCSMMHPSIKLPCVHAGLDDWISWAVYASLLEAGTPRSNSYRQCYPPILFTLHCMLPWPFATIDILSLSLTSIPSCISCTRPATAAIYYWLHRVQIFHLTSHAWT